MTPIEWLREQKKKEIIERYGDKSFAFMYQVNDIKDTSEYDLEECIIYFSKLKGFLAERTKVKPNRIDKRKTFIDSVGRVRQIGSFTFAKSSMRSGMSDMQLTINGKTVACEIKMPGDYQKKNQKEYQADVEMAGGQYWIVKDFDQFYEKYSIFANHEANRTV